MKRDDEFNALNVTNDTQADSFEFGKTQKFEFTSHKKEENTAAPKDEINDNSKARSEISDDEDKIAKQNKEDLIKDQLGDSSSGSTAESATESSAASSSSSTAAHTAGSTVSGIVVGAIAVATTAVGIVSGINVLANSKASAKLSYFEVSQTEMYYGLELFTDVDDTADYYITVKNNVYTNAQKLAKGPDEREGQGGDWEEWSREDGWYNSGVFTNLTPGTTYSLTVADISVGGNVLLDTTFRTSEPVAGPTMNSIVFDEIDYLNSTIMYHLDYEDPSKSAVLSDVRLTLDNGTYQVVYDLPADSEQHMIDVNNGTVRAVADFDLTTDNFSYTLEYTFNGESNSLSNQVDFNEGGTMESSIDDIEISEYANYETYEFTVKLMGFVDDFHIIDDIKLRITQERTQTDYTFTLEPTEEEQTLCGIVDQEVVIDVRSLLSFDAELTYTVKGEERQLTTLISPFIDNSGLTNAFNKIVFSNPNYVDKYFYVTLDYIEEIEDAFSNFVLHIFNKSQEASELVFSLDKTSEAQLIQIPEDDLETYDFMYDTLAYNLTFELFGNEDSVGDDFDFNGGGTYVTDMYGVTISETADFESYEFTVTLDFKDDFNLFDPNRFTIAITNPSGTSGYVYDLAVTTEPQTLCGIVNDEIKVDVRNGEFIYTFNYYTLDGNMGTLQSDEPFMFENGDGTIPSASIYIQEAVNFDNNYTKVTINMHDDPYMLLDNFYISFAGVVEAGQDTPEAFAELSYRNGIPQKVEFNYSFEDCPTYTYEFKYDYRGETYTDTGTVTFTDSRTKQFNYVECDWVTYQQATDDSYYLPIRLDFQDDRHEYWNFKMYFDEEEVGSLSVQTDWQNIRLSSSIPVGQVNVKIEAEGEDGSEEVFNETVTISNSDDPKVFGATVPYDEISYYPGDDSYMLYIFLLFHQDDNDPVFSNFTIIFTDYDYTGATPDSFEFGFEPEYSGSWQEQLALQDEPDLIALLEEGHRMNVTLQYFDSTLNETVSIVIASAIQFEIVYQA